MLPIAVLILFILFVCLSFLYSNGTHWVKNETDINIKGVLVLYFIIIMEHMYGSAYDVTLQTN